MNHLRAAALFGILVACSSTSDPLPDGASGNGPAGSSGGTGSNSSGGDNGSSGGTSGVVPPPAEGPRAGCKRGVAYGYHSEADMQALSKGVSWWYNWAFVPDDGVRSVFGSIGLEYIPMVWGGNVDTKQVEQQLLPGATTLLGFNEPNFHEQANMPATEAAARWPQVQAVADAKGLRLVSPAVNFCGGGCHDTDPFAYLDDFFASCDGCRVDAIGVHLYVGCKGENGNHAQWMINHLKTFEARFPDHPIWLTEFACDDAKSTDDQRAFLIDAVAFLESDPRIERYAWFAGRADNVAHVDLLGADGQLPALGQAYVDAPQNDACQP